MNKMKSTTLVIIIDTATSRIIPSLIVQYKRGCNFENAISIVERVSDNLQKSMVISLFWEPLFTSFKNSDLPDPQLPFKKYVLLSLSNSEKFFAATVVSMCSNLMNSRSIHHFLLR